tara:strand:+ start:1215 stop:1607 length:393 start_codon:yes stop_codon:yes gene_type:complete
VPSAHISASTTERSRTAGHGSSPSSSLGAETGRAEGAWYNADRLSIAVAKHETAFGTTGVGPTHNNMCGIRRNGDWEKYDSKEAGLLDCKEVLLKYQPWTINQIAQRWTTTQRQEWINNVTYFYANPESK